MGIIDYHLKERIEGKNSKITLSGRNIAWEPTKISQLAGARLLILLIQIVKAEEFN